MSAFRTLLKNNGRLSVTRKIASRNFGSSRPRVAVSTLVKKNKKPNGFQGLLALFAGIGVVAISSSTSTLYNDQNKKDDPWKSVAVDKSIDPFPTHLSAPDFPLSTKYTMLGFGTRAVTFLSFKVYGLGIYAADEDLELIPKVLDSKFLSSAFIDFDPSKTCLLYTSRCV